MTAFKAAEWRESGKPRNLSVQGYW